MTYDAASISVLKGLEAVQTRPGMYVGDVSSVAATHHLLYEVFDNAVDEALAGHARRITVRLHPDGSAEVCDDGRGIPVDTHAEMGISAAEVIFTTLHAGGKFNSDSYQFSGGLHGVGAACTNALSDWMEVEIHRDGAAWTARFEHGATVQPIAKTRSLKKGETSGTRVRFKPSAAYLSETTFEAETLRARLREVAFLNAGLEIVFHDMRAEDATPETLRFDDGMGDFVRAIAGETELVVPIVKVSGRHEGTEVDAAFTWVDADMGEDVRAYANNIPQPDGGQHVTGLRTALSRALMAHAERMKLVRRGSRMSADDLREGLAAALHVRLGDPAFSSQTKEKLISVAARTAVEALVGSQFPAWLDSHPEQARMIIQRAQAAAEAREAAKKARELTRAKKVGKRVSSASLPEKLSDCSTRVAERRELFLVEGDSAGGSAKQGRDREIQAILPLRGKILNVERAKTSQVLKNAEISAMIQTLGAGIGDKMDLSRLRYGKVVIMTDADVDGAHIATLILTFFFRQMRPLIEAGHLHLAVPPLYRVRRTGEEDIYLRTERDLTALFVDRALGRGALALDGDTASGARLRGALDPLIGAAVHLEAAARGLGHPALADVLLGSPEAQALFGTGPISERAGARMRRALARGLASADAEASWELGLFGDGVGHGLEATRTEDGISTPVRLGHADLCQWQVARVRDAFHDTGLAGTDITCAQRPVHGPLSLMEALRSAGAKGARVSRYKGLGEMNADELWETTMDPAHRTLHQVSIADAEAADRIFSDLMADNVRARRALIEEMCAGGGRLDI